MIRTRFEQRFTAERMAKDYVAVYETLGAVLAMPVTTFPLSRGAGHGEARDGDVRGAAHAA